MPDSKLADDVASYAAEVRAALAHLPEAEREILLEDLESHLEEVATESGALLEERLGKPADYAAELRVAYGAADPASAGRRGKLRDRAQALISAAIGTNAYRSLLALLPELGPGWWVLRGYLAVLILAFMLRDGRTLRPIPNPFTSFGLLEMVGIVAAIIVSVRIGRRGLAAGRIWRGAGVAGNVALAVLALPVLAEMSTAHAYPLSVTEPDGYFSAYRAGYYGPNVTNIYPYTKDGKALKEILLFDQNGRPLTIWNTKDPATDFPIDSNGKPISNEYPLTQRHFNGDPVLPPRVAIPPASQTSAPPPSPTP